MANVPACRKRWAPRTEKRPFPRAMIWPCDGPDPSPQLMDAWNCPGLEFGSVKLTNDLRKDRFAVVWKGAPEAVRLGVGDVGLGVGVGVGDGVGDGVGVGVGAGVGEGVDVGAVTVAFVVTTLSEEFPDIGTA